MSASRVVHHVRVLTSEQIQKLSPHGFRDYRNKALRMREELHCKFSPWYGEKVEPTEKEVADVRALDWLCHEINRERNRREAAEWKNRDPDWLRRRLPEDPLARFQRVK
jgi:hypothetical protein